MKLDLNIEGMTCNSCSNAITKRLSKFEFTSDVLVDWEKGHATLEIADDGQKETVVKAIEMLGYKVIP